MRRFFSPLLFIFLLLSFPALADTFSCPMRCEGKKVYSAPGTCPVCGMNLEKQVDGDGEFRPLNTRDFRMELELVPASPKAGEAVKMVFSPKHTKDSSAPKLAGPPQAVLVPQDLSHIEFLSPAPLEQGRFIIDHQFKQAGNHVVYFEFEPSGTRVQTFPMAVQVAGKKAAPPPASKSPLTIVKQAGYVFWLRVPSVIKSGLNHELSITATKADKLQELTAQKLVAISEDTTQFLPTHITPDKTKPTQVVFAQSFRRAGRYRLFALLELDAKPFQIPFTIDVTD